MCDIKQFLMSFEINFLLYVKFHCEWERVIGNSSFKGVE